MKRFFLWSFFILLTLLVVAGLLGTMAVKMRYAKLPSLDVITDYRPKIPLRIYSAEGIVIGEFGEERRSFVTIDKIPKIMKDAILAAEDDQFYQHGGVDYMGVMRAALSNFSAGGARQGASTITMQVARNFFLSPEKTLERKFNEVLLTYKIENHLSKDEILQLYMNQIFLGQKAYGFAAAAQTYFGKPLSQISIAEAAVLAGLPKAPSSLNPISNLKRSKNRQLYVLRRMHELKYITDAEYEAAKIEPLIINRTSIKKAVDKQDDVRADYVAEMARQIIYDKYGDDVYTRGYKVYTTIRVADQMAAYYALRKGVLDYDRRHGYRGPEAFIDMSQSDSDEQYEELLQEINDADDLLPALVLQVRSNQLVVYAKSLGRLTINQEELGFVKSALSNEAPLKKRIRVGSVVRIQKNKDKWRVLQLPEVEAAFVAGDPQNGQIRALIGGFDFNKNKFNHVTQAWRQPGSSIKPFIYSAALEQKFTPATIINDAPLIFDAETTGSGEAWTPQNYGGDFDGPISMRRALAKSKNLVTIRIMQAISPQYAQDYLTKFGFDASKHPAYLTMSLGAGSVTPLQMLTGYSVFANGGYKVNPYFIDRIEDNAGNVLSRSQASVVGRNASQVIDSRNAFTMSTMLMDVVNYGTATAAKQLGRSDLAGKTGTTNDSLDAWFCGYNPNLVAVSWMGFDQPRSLGEKETGGGAALPIWIGYMAAALKDEPQAGYIMPEGMVIQRVGDEVSGHDEYFYIENAPAAGEANVLESGEAPASHEETIEDQLL